MKTKITVLFCVGIVALACKGELKTQENPPQAEQKTAMDTPKLEATKIITNAYAVKDSAGVMVKDTLRMQQAVIFDSQGREASNVYYNLDGSKKWEDVFTYNADGHKNGSKYYEAGRHMITYKYELDAKGRRTAFTAYEAVSAAPLYSGYSMFNEAGTIRKDGVKNEVGIIQWNYENLYDPNGEDLGYVSIDLKTGKRYKSTYKVLKSNSEGKWIERAIIENNVVKAIETRTFIN